MDHSYLQSLSDWLADRIVQHGDAIAAGAMGAAVAVLRANNATWCQRIKIAIAGVIVAPMTGLFLAAWGAHPYFCHVGSFIGGIESLKFLRVIDRLVDAVGAGLERRARRELE